jgi:hypothetical protein
MIAVSAYEVARNKPDIAEEEVVNDGHIVAKGLAFDVAGGERVLPFGA